MKDTVPSTGEVHPKKAAPIKLWRMFVKQGEDPFSTVEWVRKTAEIKKPDGTVTFHQDNVEVPSWWSDNTVNIVAEKYLRVVDGVKENSARQLYHRVAYFISRRAVEQGLLDEESAAVLYDELVYMGLHGMHAFNSPVWFNVGVVEKPQCSACFIQSVDDTMESIMELATKEVMLFKGGSGTGANLSSLRSSYDTLSGGGRPSGPVSFMKGFDSFAGITKSGGTTRRAAKMVCMNVSHPDILKQYNGEVGFIGCKEKAEQLAHDLYATGKYTAEWNVPGNVYDLVPYQNANNSVRVTDEFMRLVAAEGLWPTREVNKPGQIVGVYKAKEIWDAICKAAWFCGDPGLQFDDSINWWHTCKASGRINASNPCSEYMFLDDSACNLSSLNLLAFAEPGYFKVKEFNHACYLATICMEVLVDASSYPSEKIRQHSHEFRPLGLGYANLGALLTFWGLPYDSAEGRDVAAAITAQMTATAYAASAHMAFTLGPFDKYLKNKDTMLSVIHEHGRSLGILKRPEGKGGAIYDSAEKSWKAAEKLGKEFGFRNAQTTVLAPTGTISFMMGCDTTGIEPMTAVVTWKKIVGGGLLKLPNAIVEPALENLGYGKSEIAAILSHISDTGDIHSAPYFDTKKHGAVFAEALGSNAISANGHVDMMAAVQPFLSGSISKTVNLPSTATPEDISSIYTRAWKMGLKCIAVYRDGCKLSQPISKEKEKVENTEAPAEGLQFGGRKKLPETRAAITHKFNIADQEGYLTVGLYEEGKVGELFLRISKAGSSLHGLLDAWATAVSIGLQYGVPLDLYTEKFIDTRFEPSGFTQNSEIRYAKSLPDYIFRWLKQHYIDSEEIPVEVEAPKKTGTETTSKGFDGPPCRNCGNMTKRSGSCYVCNSCGQTTGCS